MPGDVEWAFLGDPEKSETMIWVGPENIVFTHGCFYNRNNKNDHAENSIFESGLGGAGPAPMAARAPTRPMHLRARSQKMLFSAWSKINVFCCFSATITQVPLLVVLIVREPMRFVSNRTQPNRTDPNRTEPLRTEPNRTE